MRVSALCLGVTLALVSPGVVATAAQANTSQTRTLIYAPAEADGVWAM